MWKLVNWMFFPPSSLRRRVVVFHFTVHWNLLLFSYYSVQYDIGLEMKKKLAHCFQSIDPWHVWIECFDVTYYFGKVRRENEKRNNWKCFDVGLLGNTLTRLCPRLLRLFRSRVVFLLQQLESSSLCASRTWTQRSDWTETKWACWRKSIAFVVLIPLSVAFKRQDKRNLIEMNVVVCCASV